MEFSLENIIGKSKAIRDVLEMVKKVARTQATVLISGDSGTGKELIALALHAHSDRKDKLFLPVNCGALPETLLESLLFGHMKGSFTGAFANQEGLFEKARAGCRVVTLAQRTLDQGSENLSADPRAAFFSESRLEFPDRVGGFVFAQQRQPAIVRFGLRGNNGRHL